ncbi:TIM-barrel domain-containing protein [Cohnella sp.]|uniref:TIM-barrel domain-containing protein n=1 Tax=Cohnella sp. TaxID=1883426 RepID=UPI003565FD9F
MLRRIFNKKFFNSFVVVLLLSSMVMTNAFAIDGTHHKPYGDYDLYSIQSTERFPRDPIAGDTVYLNVTTWPVESGQATWITWTKNGVAQSDIGGSWSYNSGNNTYWSINMGSFAKGDVITYTVHANKDGTNEKTSGPFTFTATGWESISSISSYTDSSNHVVLTAAANTGTFTPKINLAFTADDVLRVQLSPKGTSTMATGLSNYSFTDHTTYYTLVTSKLSVRVDKNPYKMSVYKADGTTLIAEEYDSTVNRNMAWLTDGNNLITKVEDHFDTPTTEEFYGFGEHYNDMSKRGQIVDTYVYNQYKDQNDRTYLSIPFFLNTKGYGIFLNSTYYSQFRLATDLTDMYSFTADTGGASTSMLDYYFIYGDDLKDVNTNYAAITGLPTMLPKWAFGLWMSANEWDRESEVTSNVSSAASNNIPTTAIVLEQWSDEETFYIWNDASYTPVTGSAALNYSDFTFPSTGKWPNPAGMVSDLHADGIKVLLWQIPVEKYLSYSHTQKDNDESYMISQGYAVGDGAGGQYRLPPGWFGDGLLVDFTSSAATNWWMSKRAYLFDSVGIDGFKTDGGEMVFGKELTFSNGKKGDEMRNQYPNDYVQAYNDYSHTKKADSVSFSRSGTTGAQRNQIYWAGDQASTFSAFRDAVRAGLTSNMSGVPFWSWDLAGFSGNFPTAELYKRSTEMAAFSPIMQFHSEANNPSTSEERTPWNVQTRTGDNTIISHFAKYTNTRMNLLPYLFSEAKKTSDTGIPMMRSMVLEYPNDTNTYHLDAQYMFGDNLLVAPIVNEGETNKSIYLPEGDWIDFWWGVVKPGSQTISYYAGVDDLPVYVKSGSIIPMNLNADYALGGTIGNSMTSYNNLTFRVYPSGTTSYAWNDDIGGSVKTITSTEEYNLSKETVSLPATTTTATLQVFTTEPSSVTADGVTLTKYNSLANLISNATGWYYDPSQKFAYVKVGSSASARSIVLNGVHKVAYEDALGDVIGTSVSGDTLTLTVDNGTATGDDTLIVTALESGLLKVDYRPSGIAASAQTPMIDPNKTWSAAGSTINTASDPITITTADMKVEISKVPARLTIKKADNTTLFWEPNSGGTFSDGVKFKHDTGHNMYGIRSFDANESGGDILRNNSTHPAHAGQQGDAGGPFIWSTSGYGLLVDSDGGYPVTDDAAGNMEFYYGATPTEGRRFTKDNVEYYIMVGDPEEIMTAASNVTGKAPLMPKWSLGFMNFEWGINETEMTNMVDTYRAKNIPIDAYAIDYDWKKYGETNYGEFAWNTTNFPGASSTSLKTTMDGKGIKMIGITKPRIVTLDANNNRTSQYYDAEAGGYWYPGHNEYTDYFIPVKVRSIDPYNASQRSWFWSHSEDAFDKGIVGWWNDETDKVTTDTASYWFGNFSTTYASQAMYDGQRTYTNDSTRVWQASRTFYPGAQRYATTLWSGDIGIQFVQGEEIDWATGMQEQRANMLSAINMGQNKWGMDAGGFNGYYGTIKNPSPELYARWLQFSALTPVFRVHGNLNQQRQPWYYGSSAEEATKAAIQFRYSLLPYMYSYERTASENGLGLVKPLIFDNPTDANVANSIDSWMFGDWMLASPVVERGQTSKSIYLPAGTWTDYFRGNTYTGGQTINYPLNSESWTDMPVFIKKGAIIPSQKVVDYIGQSSITSVNVDVFPDTTESSFTYYDDDGSSYNYESGTYFKQVMTAQDNGVSGISFDIAAKSGTYTPAVTSYLVEIHGKAGTAATMNGVALTSYADLNALKAATGEGWTTGKDLYGDVTYVKAAAASASAKSIVVTGTATPSATAAAFEAEDGSLSGATTATKATINTNHTGYTGTGFVDGMNNADAAATIYADVRTDGDYSVGLRYANATGSTKTMSIFVNGARVKQTSLATLANWDTWATQSETLPLKAGRNTITYKYYSGAGDSGNVNLDNITVALSPTIAKYEAESEKLSGGAATDKDHWYYTGAAFVDGMTAVGAQTKFTVYAPSAGTYSVALRYANGNSATKVLSTYVNGSKIGTVNYTSPGANWNVWQDNVQTLTLTAGLNTIAYHYDSGDSGNINLDRILVAATTPGTPTSEMNLLDNAGFDRDTSFNSNWAEWHPTGQSLAYGIDSGSKTYPPESPWTEERRAYFYLSGAYQQSIHQVVSVPTNNANYKFEAWVRYANTTATTARAEISNYGGTTQYYNISKDGVWKYISISNIFVSNGQIDVGFYVDSPGGTTLHIDDVRITKE